METELDKKIKKMSIEERFVIQMDEELFKLKGEIEKEEVKKVELEKDLKAFKILDKKEGKAFCKQLFALYNLKLAEKMKNIRD